MNDNTICQHEISGAASVPCELTRTRGRPRLEQPVGLPGLAGALLRREWGVIQLAAASDVHPSTIMRAMRGKDISLDALRKLRDALGVTADDLLGPSSVEVA